MNLDEERKIKEAFDDEAHSRGFCLDQEWSNCENSYLDGDTNLAFDFFKSGWQAAKAQEAEKLKGCVVAPFNNTTIVAIEKMVEQQVEASGITEDVFRLDGEKILNAAVEAARGGNE